MASAEPALLETHERRCPACQSENITPANHLRIIDNAVFKEEFRCTVCGTAFWIVRTEPARP